jgi:subtilisin family serine protease
MPRRRCPAFLGSNRRPTSYQVAGRWQVAGHIGDEYARMSGTSMATPHVTGAAALLAQQHADWTGAQLKATLMATATEGGKVEQTIIRAYLLRSTG